MEPVELTIEEVRGILGSGEFDRLVGRAENEFFDAKMKSWGSFSDINNRFELAKDVSSFANSNGGYILVGLEEEQKLSEKRGYVKRLSLIPQGEFDISAIRGVVKANIFDELTGLEVAWRESSSTKGVGIGYVFIPPQDEGEKPFLMKEVTSGEGVVRPVAFGLAVRNDSDSNPLSLKELQVAINRGKRPESVRLENIESKVDSILETISGKEQEENMETKFKDQMRSITEKK
jgi:hypothetical protein